MAKHVQFVIRVSCTVEDKNRIEKQIREMLNSWSAEAISIKTKRE